MAAKCSSKQELRSAIGAILASGVCDIHCDSLDGRNDDRFPDLTYDGEDVSQMDWDRFAKDCVIYDNRLIPLHEFILRGIGMWDQAPSVMVNGHKAVFSKGSVKIGCTTVTNEEVREVYKQLID